MIDFVENPLVETDWLAEHISDENLRIVDARWRGDGSARSRYKAGHIPGAVHLDWQFDLTSTQENFRFMLLPPDEFAEQMAAAGIGAETKVLAYAELDYSGAARLWWALRYYGHQQVAVLNGGITKWIAEKRPLEKKTPSPARTTFFPKPQAQLLAGLDEVKDSVSRRDGSVSFVDTRPIEQFQGRAVWTPQGSLFLPDGQDWVDVDGRAMRAGHLPGAVHLNSTDNFDQSDWTLREPGDIHRDALAAGIKPDQRVITYCGCGMSASLGLFALHLAGFENIALFDGSWEQW
ncbi:MAG: sulfurtransferase, partial [Anaerolineales bacterium]|nr:sulfurtransferase [Anaerolineales bacterium]